MRNVTKSVLLLGGAFIIAACSAGDDTGEKPSPLTEAVTESKEYITGACSELTFGLPCDPDGPLGNATECEGVCWLGFNGNAACVPMADAGLASLDGRICGTAAGVGNAACANTCKDGKCQALAAAAGTACRPDAQSNSCAGQCNNLGQCQPLGANVCPFGRDNCIFTACNPLNVAQCTKNALLKSSDCTDGNACTLADQCDGNGGCAPGAPKACDDNNVCTDNGCNTQSGACVFTPNNNACNDGNACTSNDTCSGGQCVGGGATNCDDQNACTADSCAPATGCVHVAKNCNDGNACTQDGCDSTSGQCTHSAVTCNDNNACTNDSCNQLLGCVFTPKNCDDGNACTLDGCNTQSGACTNTKVTCDDGNACTNDSCNVGSGCIFTPIPNCVPDAGTGGTGGGNTGGTGGAATGGTGGSATGGTGGVTEAPAAQRRRHWRRSDGRHGWQRDRRHRRRSDGRHGWQRDGRHWRRDRGTGGAATGGTGGATEARAAQRRRHSLAQRRAAGTGGSATGGTGGASTGGAGGTPAGGSGGVATGGVAGAATGGAAGTGTGGASGLVRLAERAPAVRAPAAPAREERAAAAPARRRRGRWRCYRWQVRWCAGAAATMAVAGCRVPAGRKWIERATALAGLTFLRRPLTAALVHDAAIHREPARGRARRVASRHASFRQSRPASPAPLAQSSSGSSHWSASAQPSLAAGPAPEVPAKGARGGEEQERAEHHYGLPRPPQRFASRHARFRESGPTRALSGGSGGDPTPARWASIQRALPWAGTNTNVPAPRRTR
ncbi:MAG: hypothetical protein U0263_19185 [Polyangiaceae bacterium]